LSVSKRTSPTETTRPKFPETEEKTTIETTPCTQN
jgi:hypothetical protein